jgi:3D (Asp-Asp-Asp) domain-containing protein
VVRQKDDTMAKGEEEVVQVGQPGLERVQRETLYSNGTVIKTNDVSKVIQRAMVPTIIKEGTREVTTSRNVASRAIVMEASAYLAGDGDGAGITATGLPAVRGIAAVDPDVIPLGTRLFIPGYGEAIAADTGGAIVGNKIDLVMDSYGEAMDFGRQDVTVYVLD